MSTPNYFIDRLKINNDPNNWRGGSHFDIMTDLRNDDIYGIEKTRIATERDPMNGETVVGRSRCPGRLSASGGPQILPRRAARGGVP